MKMTKARLDGLLFAQNRRILDVLPDIPGDPLDEFILEVLGRQAIANQGCGFEAVQAMVKLEAIREMSYADIRFAAGHSPDYADYEHKRIDEREKSAAQDRTGR